MKEYWLAVAQILPVIGLAVVLEARFVRSRWTSRTSRGLRRVYAIIWWLYGSAVGTAIFSALRYGRGGDAPDWAATCVEWLIFGGVLLVVSLPISEIFQTALAEDMFNAQTFDPRILWNIWKLRRRTKSLRAEHAEAEKDLLAKTEEFRQWVTANRRRMRARMPTLDPSVVQPYVNFQRECQARLHELEVDYVVALKRHADGIKDVEDTLEAAVSEWRLKRQRLRAAFAAEKLDPEPEAAARPSTRRPAGAVVVTSRRSRQEPKWLRTQKKRPSPSP